MISIKAKNESVWRIIILIFLNLGITFFIFLKAGNSPTHPIDSTDSSTKEGLKIWYRENCISCHSIYGLGGHIGPDLTNVISTKGEKYVDYILITGKGKMPAQSFADKEIKDLISYLRHIDALGNYPLKSTKGNQFGNNTNNTVIKRTKKYLNDTPKTDLQSAKKGLEIWNSENCISCHSINKYGGYVAPDLTNVINTKGEKFVEYILANKEHKARRKTYTTKEIQNLIGFLSHIDELENNPWNSKKEDLSENNIDSIIKNAQNNPIISSNFNNQEIQTGLKIWHDGKCVYCHSVFGTGGQVGPDLTEVTNRRKEKYIKNILINGKGRMPEQTLSNEEIENLLGYLKLINKIKQYRIKKNENIQFGNNLSNNKY